MTIDHLQPYTHCPKLDTSAINMRIIVLKDRLRAHIPSMSILDRSSMPDLSEVYDTESEFEDAEESDDDGTLHFHTL
jgi:hypothetical protein